MTSQISKVSKI